MRIEKDTAQYLLDQVARLTAENAMLKEKWSAPKQREPEQEPVATKLESHQFTAFHVSALDFKKLQKLPIGTKLYTAPPKREPLSDKEIHAYLSLMEPPFLWDEGFCSGIEWAEKQHGIGGGV